MVANQTKDIAKIFNIKFLMKGKIVMALDESIIKIIADEYAEKVNEEILEREDELLKLAGSTVIEDNRSKPQYEVPKNVGKQIPLMSEMIKMKTTLDLNATVNLIQSNSKGGSAAQLTLKKYKDELVDILTSTHSQSGQDVSYEDDAIFLKHLDLKNFNLRHNDIKVLATKIEIDKKRSKGTLFVNLSIETD